MPLNFSTLFDDDSASTMAPKQSARRSRRFWSLAADGCYILIKGSAFTVSTFLMTLGLPLFFFLLLAGWNMDALFMQLGNIAGRYADAEPARQIDFSQQFQIGFLAVATLVAMWRIPHFVAEIGAALDRSGEK